MGGFDYGLWWVIIPTVVICGIIFVGAGIIHERHEINSLSLGDEVRTSDYYNECFNESFMGRAIGLQIYRCTVRDKEGNERTFEKRWLVKTGR